MEVDIPLEEEQQHQQGDQQKDGKRTKWQLPPSHHILLSSPVGNHNNKPKCSRQHSSGGGGMAPFNGQDEEFADSRETNNAKPTLDTVTLEAMAEALSQPKLTRLTHVAKAEICPKIKRARLMSTKGIAAKIRDQYGYEISNTTFLYAEEAMYLLELGKLELTLGKVNVSVERARTLLIHSRSLSQPDPHGIKSCSLDEYLVYKHLSELGYRVRRRDSDIRIKSTYPVAAGEQGQSSNNFVQDNSLASGPDEMKMDLDDEPISIPNRNGECQSANNNFCCETSTLNTAPQQEYLYGQRGTKRKFGEVSDNTPGSTTSSAKDMSDDDDADEEFEFSQNIGDSYMDSTEDTFYFHPTTSSYTVTEADSDVEISDEPQPGPSCRSGVYIEEIGHGYDGDTEDILTQEPQPSTSAACFATDSQTEALVDLADSDTEKEEVASFSRIWNKFVPNTTIQIGFPPSALLPENIPEKNTIYEFDLKSRESARSDSDLEYFVDELTLNPPSDESGENENKGKKNNYKCWKEWRRGTVNEAQSVLGESLLGQSRMCATTVEEPMQKLHLWGQKEPESKRRAEGGWNEFSIPFELYHPSVGFNKHRCRKEISPSYVIATVRNDEEVPSFATCDSLFNGIPVLIAVVSDESTIMFMNPDGSPIPSLF